MTPHAALCRITAGLAIATLQAHACGTLPALPSPPPGALRVTDFGALPDDDLDDDAAIARALKALQPGGWLVFPPGRYRQAHSLLVTVPGATLWGPGATLQATDPRDHTLGLRADGVRLYGLTLTARPDQRRSEPAQARLSLYRDRSDNRDGTTPQRGNVVRGVTIDGAGSVGILVHGAADFTVAGNTVRNTLADGIHVTGGSHHGRVLGNQVRDTGDDLVSIVSYDDAPPVRDVLVADNVVSGARWGRGLSIVGGEHLTLRGNTVSGVAHGAGILVAQEGNWHTHGVRDVRIEDNRLREIQTPAARVGVTAPSTGHAAIEIHTYAVPAGATGIGDILLQGNTVAHSRYGELRQRAGRLVQTTPGAQLDCSRFSGVSGR
jgi:parallel beta-helix repeat protein